MPSEWPLVTIGSVASVFDGPHATPKKTDIGPVFLGISSLNWGQLDLSTTEHLSADDFAKWTRRVAPQADDVVFSYETRLGQAAIIPAGLRCCLGRRMALVRTDKSRLLPRFFLYYFLSDEFQSLLQSRTIHGSTVERLPLTDFPQFPIRLPSLEVQRLISETLEILDDKIALLRETNATLEAIAQALFKSWFVDFDPVRAKRDGREPEGVPPEVADLFPSVFEDSEWGEIPKGWRVSRLGDVIELAYGKALKTTDRRPGSVPVYGSGGITGFHDTAYVDGPSIVVGRKGTVGSLYWEDKPFFPIDTVFFVKPRDVPLTYCYYAMQRLGLEDMNTDAAVPGLNRENAYRLPVVMPTPSILDAFDEVAVTLRERIRRGLVQQETLASLRDTFLPRLMSGKLRLTESASISEAAL